MTPGGRPTLTALGDADDALDSAGQHFAQFAAAYVRSKSAQTGEPFLAPDLASKDLLDLTPPEIAAILEAGRNASLKLRYFKSGHAELPRCRRAVGILRSIMPTSLLDVGSGRGTFLWPCLDAFPDLRAHSVDLLSHRTQVLCAVRRGGVHRLSAETGDFCAMSFPAGAYEVVTLLEVLEHMRDPAAAVRNAVNAASRQVVVSVPSKPDSNPEHIHLLTKSDLTQLFQQAGCSRLRFDGVAQVRQTHSRRVLCPCAARV